MFNFGLSTPFPWENGVKPDIKSETMELYIENSFTKYLRNRNGKRFKPTENWFIALVRFTDGYTAWVISDGKGILDETQNAESIWTLADKWQLILEFNK